MWTLTLFRALSGVQNALYYAKLDMIAKLWALGLIAYICWMLDGWYIASSIGVVFAYLSFEGKLWKGSIHLVEIFKTGLPILAYFVSGGESGGHLAFYLPWLGLTQNGHKLGVRTENSL